MPAYRLTEIPWVDLNLSIYCLQQDCSTEWTEYPKLIALDWRQLPVPTQYTDPLK